MFIAALNKSQLGVGAFLRRAGRSILLAGSVALLLSQSAHGASQDWSGGSSSNGNWSTSANWGNNNAPGSGNTATFDVAIAHTWGSTALIPVVIDSTTQNIGSITFTSAAGSYFIGSTNGNSLLLTDGGTIQITNALSNTVNHVVTETINAPLVIEDSDSSGSYTFTNSSANGTAAKAGILDFGGGITAGGSNGTATLTLNGSNTNANTISGVIANGAANHTLAVSKSGSGTWILSGENTFSGGTTISTGTLDINNAGTGASNSALGTGTFTISGGTIDNTSSGAIDLTSTTNNAVSITGSFAFGGTNDLDLGTAAVSLTYSDTNDSEVITLNGSGTLTLGAVASDSERNDETLTVNGSGKNLVLGSFALNKRSSAETNIFNGSGNITINGAVTPGSGGSTSDPVTYSGTGTLTLGGNNTYNGLTTVSTGTLTLGGSNSGTGGVTLGGTTSTTAAQLNINNSGADATHSALGTGTFTIAGSSGTLTIDNTSDSPVTIKTNNAITIADDFTFGGSDDLNLGTGAVSDSDSSNTITLDGGTLTFGGTLTNTSSSSQTLTVTGPGALALGGYALANSSTARSDVIKGSANVSIGVVSDGASTSNLTYNGSGTLTLSGTSTYGGTTTVLSGVVAVNGSLASGSAVTVGGTTTNGASGTPTLTGTGTVNGSVTLHGSSSGNVAGTVNPGGVGGTPGTLTVGSISFASGSTFAVDISGNSTDELVVSGATTSSIAITSGANISINASGLTSGLYVLGSAPNYTGTTGFNTAFTVTGALPTGYKLVATAKTLDLQESAGQSFSNPATINIIAGATSPTIALATLNNTAFAGGASLTVSLAPNGGTGGAVNSSGLSAASGSPLGANSSTTVSGTFTAGNTVGTGQTFIIKNTDTNATNTTATATGTVNVYNHAAGTLTLTSLNSVNAISGTVVNSTLTFLNNGANNDGLSIVTPGTGVTGLSGTFAANAQTTTVNGATTAGAAGGTTIATYSTTWLEDQSVFGATTTNQTATAGAVTITDYSHAAGVLTVTSLTTIKAIHGQTINSTLAFKNNGATNDNLTGQTSGSSGGLNASTATLTGNQTAALIGSFTVGAAGSTTTNTYTQAWQEDSSVLGATTGVQTSTAGVSVTSYNNAVGVLTLTSLNSVNAISGTVVNSTLTFLNDGANNDSLSIVTPGTGVTGLSGTFAGNAQTTTVNGATTAGTAGTTTTATYSTTWLEDQTVIGATPGNQTATAGSVTIHNLGHSSPSLTTSSASFGTVHAGTNVATQSTTLSNGSGPLAGLQITSLTSGLSDSGSGLIAAGTGRALNAAVGVVSTGSYDQVYTIATSDDTSVLGHTANNDLTFTVTGTVYSGLSVWKGNGTSTGTWGTLLSGFGSNWGATQGSPGLDPDFASSDTATFDSTGLVGTSDTVSLGGASPSLNSIIFNTPVDPITHLPTGYTIDNAGGGSLALNGTGVGDGTASIKVISGNDTISAPVSLNTDTNINVASGQQLNLSGGVSGGGKLITTTGTGTTTLSGPNPYSGGTSVGAGTLFANGGVAGTSSGLGTGAVSVAAGASVGGSGVYRPTTLGAGITLAGSGSNLISGAAVPVVGQGLTLDNRVAQGTILDASTGTANLTFSLGAGNPTNASTYSFSNPNTASTYLTLYGGTAPAVAPTGPALGQLAFAAGDTFTLVDLTGSPTSLELNMSVPYVLIKALSSPTDTGSVLDNNFYSGLMTTGGIVDNVLQNGYVTTPLTLDGSALVGFNADRFFLYNGELEVVPEPGTWALVLSGLALLIFIQRRRSQR